MKRIFKRLAFSILTLSFLYLLLLINPKPLFSQSFEYQQFKIFSDEPVPKEMTAVLDDVKSRISKSELYSEDLELQLFICNQSWRFTFFTRNPNPGGVVMGLLSPNAFIRACNIPKNKLIPPPTWTFPVEADRPLSYFIAHEFVHSLQAHYDRFLHFKIPIHIMEGYTDYIAKAPDFDFETYKSMYLNNAPKMNPENGTYHLYHFFAAFMIEKRGYDFEKLVREKPGLGGLEELKLKTDSGLKE